MMSVGYNGNRSFFVSVGGAELCEVRLGWAGL